MKSASRLLLAGLLALCSMHKASADDFAYPSLLIDDLSHVIRAPAYWESEAWQEFGLASAAVVGTAFLVDRPLRDFMRKQDQHNPFWLQVEKFGREYALATMGGLAVAGALGNEKARAAAQDSISASLISSGIITSGIKLIVGRARPAQNNSIFYSKPFNDLNSSFPSGHATQAFALASVLAEHYNETWQQTTFYSLAMLAALARPYHDRHYASDILAGGFIGTWVGRQVVSHNRTLRSGKTALLPEIAPGLMGIRIAGSF